MQLIKRSTSLPNLLQRMRSSNTLVTPWTVPEDTSTTQPLRTLATVRCRLSTEEQEHWVKVTLQILNDHRRTHIKVFKSHVCILHLPRDLLRFSENIAELKLALTAKQPGYDWWVLEFDKKHLKHFLEVHYLIMQDASL